SRDDRVALLLFVAAVIAVMLSLGTHLGVLYAFANTHVPLLSRFRVPVAIMIVAQLALALLSGRGLDRLLHATAWRELRVRFFVLAGVGALATLLGLAIALGPLRDGYLA